MTSYNQILENQEKKTMLKSILKDHKQCNASCRCGPVITDDESGEIFCGSCGHVFEERSFERIPESYHGSMDFMARSTAPIPSVVTFDTNTVTIIANRDGLGKSLSTKTRDSFFRLKRLNNRSSRYGTSQTLRSSLSLLNTIRMKLGLPDSLVESAAYLYKKSRRDKIRIGMNTKNLMCACIYVACKKQGIPRSILEISLVSNIKKKEIARACRTLVNKMEISLVPFNPSEFLTKIANEAKISEKSRRDAIDILAIAEKAKITDGKNPKALAAASLYLSCTLNNEKKSQAQLAKASGISTNTVRTRYSELKLNIF